MNDKLLSLYGLKFHPFRPDIPIEAVFPMPHVDAFCRRVELALTDGGFVMATGDPGTGKSVAMRLLAHRLGQQRDVAVGVINHPQSRLTDFYRELGDAFGVPMPNHNRWGSFKALRERWSHHIESSLTRPVLIIDEAQEMLTTVLNELRVLSSKQFDSQALLCVVLAGDSRLPQRFRSTDLLPLGSRIRRRLELGYADRESLSACLDHVLEVAGNSSLMNTEVKTTLAEHAAGNYRVMMNLADELLGVAAEQELPSIDETLYFDVFQPNNNKRRRAARKR